MRVTNVQYVEKVISRWINLMKYKHIFKYFIRLHSENYLFCRNSIYLLQSPSYCSFVIRYRYKYWIARKMFLCNFLPDLVKYIILFDLKSSKNVWFLWYWQECRRCDLFYKIKRVFFVSVISGLSLNTKYRWSLCAAVANTIKSHILEVWSFKT